MPLAASPAQTIRSPRSLTLAAHAALVPVGMVTVLLGPMLPILSVRWSLNHLQAGYLFSAQFIGATMGVAFSGRIIERWGYRAAMLFGLVALLIGVALLPFMSFAGGLVAILCYGVAIGMMGPTCNLLVAAIHPGNRGAALNLLNFSWSVGAVGCPFLVAAAVRAHQTVLPPYVIAGLTLTVILSIYAIGYNPIDTTAQVSDNAASPAIAWRGSGLVVLAALFFLYAGTENGIGGWLASFAQRVSGPASSLPTMTSSFFYLALLVGRCIAPFVLRRMAEVTLARVGLLIACAGTLALILANTWLGVVCSASTAGLGLSAVFPITISLLARKFGAASARAGSILFNMANAGGATLPLLVGYTSHRWGSLQAGLAIVLAAAVIMLALYFSEFEAEGNDSRARVVMSR